MRKLYGTTLLMEETPVKESGTRFVDGAIDHVRIKGRSRPVAIHEALGDKAFTFTQEQL
jgi:hypothetical protein